MTSTAVVRTRTSGVGLFAAGCVLLLVGCAKPSTPTPRSAGSSALKPISQAALQSVVDTTARELMVPGAMVLLRAPEREFTVAYGTTELGRAIPPRSDTHFRIASNTKTMTAAVILQLAQEGKLRLDDAVSKYFPRVPNGDEITVAELLEMRSGLYNYLDAPEVSASADRDPTRVWTSEELVAIAFARPPNFPPGRPSSTATRTTRCSVSSRSESTASHWPGRCRIGCSDRRASGKRRFPQTP